MGVGVVLTGRWRLCVGLFIKTREAGRTIVGSGALSGKPLQQRGECGEVFEIVDWCAGTDTCRVKFENDGETMHATMEFVFGASHPV